MDWKGLVGSVAPILGGSLGGPFGAMAGKWLAGQMGVDESELETTVTNATPDTMLKIKELDNSFKVEMAKLGLDEKKLHADDRASARVMASKTTLLPQMIISCIFMLGFVAILIYVFSSKEPLPDGIKDMANYLLGILSAGIVQIMNFFFGSSAGSKEKTLQMGEKTK
ncbi:hypothetical protein MNBD_GAMMA08-70 [hydrothermal vent metagenome]|uniref:TMhelix containing protein n=1 Tax=hydrothermal vent metagenome TaxID=652676 RepID=A0A3B0XE25_9ZZZZ